MNEGMLHNLHRAGKMNPGATAAAGYSQSSWWSLPAMAKKNSNQYHRACSASYIAPLLQNTTASKPEVAA
jgi:hypothetical protein